MITYHAARSRVLAAVAAVLMAAGTPISAFAQETVPVVAPVEIAPPIDVAAPITAPHAEPMPVIPTVPIHLDLTSTERTLAAPQFVQNAPVNVVVGGEALAITSSSLLTPGERLAAYQVFSTGQQSILLGSQGNAIGGTFNIDANFSQYVSGLVLPQGVTALQHTETLSLVGNLTNAGTLSVMPTAAGVTTASISALNILNQQGALINSMLNLSLFAVNNITNLGTISSAGALNMVAGGTITNALPAGIMGPSPTLTAVNNLMMQASNIINAGQILSQQGSVSAYASNLTNAGMMQSLMSNIAVQNQFGNTLSVINTLGTMQALGTIDFQTLGVGAGKSGIDLTGGTLSAQSVNFASPEGLITVNSDTISGAVNISGGAAMIGVDRGTLSISSMDLTGDPLVFNTTGDVVIDLALFATALATPGEDWTFLAGRHILAGAGTAGQTFNTGTGAFGNLTLASGVTFIPAGGPGTIFVPGAVVPFIVTGTSATGGNIQLAGVNLQTDGRTISLEARGLGLIPGSIDVGNITSSGISGQPAGAITITATGPVTTGAITSIGGQGFNGGAISIATAQTISSDSLISLGGNGGLGLAGGLGGAISLAGAGNSTVAGTITSQGGDGGDGAAGGGAAGAGGTGGDISLAFAGNIGGQQVLSRGGDGGDGGVGGVGIVGGAAGAGGTGGNISMAAGGMILTIATLSIGGDGGVGGSGDPGGAGGLGGTGGDISMVAAGDVLPDTVISFGGLGGVGGVGTTPVAGGQGGVGGGGGTGGNISLTSGNDINVCQVVSFGGAGAAGATGESGTDGGQGGAGGIAGVGGNISLTAGRDVISERLVSIGGDGGMGADGNAVGAGGNGGAGGGGGTSGNISVTAGRTSISDQVVTLGGLGGIGGLGVSGGAGGAGGAGGGGGTGGDISVTTTVLDIIGNDFISTGGAGGAGGNGTSGAANGTGGTGGGGSVGGNISLTAGRDAVVCCVISIGGVGGAGGSGQSIGAGGAGGSGGGGGRGGDLSVTTGRNSVVDQLITIGGAGGAGGAGGIGGVAAPGGAGGLGGRGGDISVTAAALIFRNIMLTRGGLGGIAGPGTPPGVAGGTGINGTIALTTPNAIIDFVAPNCVNCLRLDAGAIQSSFRAQVMAALAANTVISCDTMMIQVEQCPLPPPPATITLFGAATTTTVAGGGGATTPISLLPSGVPTIIGNQCVAYNIYDVKESFLQATEGTQLQVAGADGVNVSNGQVVVKAGATELTFRSASAEVTLKPHAVAVIESNPGQPTSIVALDALGEDGVTVHVGSDSYTLQPGEKIMITGRVSTTQLANGVQTGETSAAGRDNRHVVRASVNLSEYIPKMAFLQCRDCAFRDYLDSKFQQDGRISRNTYSGNGLLPVAYVETNSTQAATTTGFLKSTTAVVDSIGTNHFKMDAGNLLFEAQDSTRIDTPHGQLFAKPGAIVLMAVEHGVTRVRDLHDESPDDVVFTVDGRSIPLSPGREVTLTNQAGEALPLVYQDGMSRRGITLTEHAGTQIVTADFSILNAFMLQPLLRDLRASKASNDIRLTKSIMKTASAISLTIDRYKGPYYASVATGTGVARQPVEVTLRRK